MLTVNGHGGNDSFTVGGGDIDSNGFSLNNVTVNGGLGVDSMRFDDQLDDAPNGSTETETYLHTALSGVNKLAKGTAGVNYSSCESLTIDTADRATGSTVWGNTVALITFSSFIGPITHQRRRPAVLQRGAPDGWQPCGPGRRGRDGEPRRRRQQLDLVQRF